MGKELSFVQASIISLKYSGFQSAKREARAKFPPAESPKVEKRQDSQ